VPLGESTRLCLVDDVDNMKVVEDVHVPSKTASIIEDMSVGSNTPVIDEVHMSFDSTNNDVNEIIETNIPTVPSKSFEFFCTEYSFMVSTESYCSESSEFLVMIHHMVSNTSFSSFLEFVFESNIPSSQG